MQDLELARILDGIVTVSASEMKVKELELFLIARGIEHLYHFTSIQNLESLRDNNFLGRETLVSSGLPFQASDLARIEPIDNAICFSFSKPNKFMMMNKISAGRDIVLLELDNPLEILSTTRFIASPGNFGKQTIKAEFMNWPEKFTGGLGLTRLFLNENLRSKYNLEPYETTDPQAELILLDSLPWKFVRRNLRIDNSGIRRWLHPHVRFSLSGDFPCRFCECYRKVDPWHFCAARVPFWR
ncbi:MAG: DUF4433 domain-containing protein [Micrococcales bacterium]|nr:DUF4433 domain-containing protein [Micrococcales bacterium]